MSQSIIGMCRKKKIVANVCGVENYQEKNEKEGEREEQ